jgi:hypothetical protein
MDPARNSTRPDAVRDEPKIVDLIEARERLDRGRRLALVEAREEAEASQRPEVPGSRFDGLGADGVPDLAMVVENISGNLRAIEQDLAYLSGAVDGDTLPGHVVSRFGLAASELREQVPTLRAAVRDSGDAA